jgi:CubicO group peptidase (beta-lactamase class C family)
MAPRFLTRCALALCLCAAALRPQEAPTLPADAITAIEAAIQSEQKRMKIPGLAVAIGRAGEIRYSRGFGLADVENQVPATPQTRFRTASIAKPMTAVAIMQLASQGRLDLDIDHRRYVKVLHPRFGVITLRHLLCHQSGLRHYTEVGEATGTRSFKNLEESTVLFRDGGPGNKPGAKFSYSTYAYTLLGMAIERASRQPYGTYMKEHVWGPAGMQHTGIDWHYEIIPHRASGYMLAEKKTMAMLPDELRERVHEGDLLRAPLHDTSMKVPGGGISSTAEDLVRFGIAMLQNRLVDAATREQMWTSAKTTNGSKTRVGLGWFFYPEESGRQVGHSGGQAGTTCMLAIDPKSGVVVAMMTNLQSASGVPLLTRRLVGMVGP